MLFYEIEKYRELLVELEGQDLDEDDVDVSVHSGRGGSVYVNHDTLW